MERVADRYGVPLASVVRAEGPVVAFALHAGHALRPGLDEVSALSEDDRLREEDPYTATMVPDGVSLVEAVRSRFEVDLNRPRERAVYRGPEDAWGLDLYRRPPSADVLSASLSVYDDFYETAHAVLTQMERDHGRFVVLDLHSYNHRRDGMTAVASPIERNPEVNLGTGRIDRDRWGDVADSFMESMLDSGFDCRENVRFRGGYFSQWVSENFPESGVALAIEFKKIYMDEWTGRPDHAAILRIREALGVAIERIEEALSARAWSSDRVPSIEGLRA
ncbi:MAG: N-formylglutamate amidohydrolase [Coriobacteriia bacterium]|nr:N-formylglutamate amidohydrolase [Coriobacteriia bacterium]